MEKRAHTYWSISTSCMGHLIFTHYKTQLFIVKSKVAGNRSPKICAGVVLSSLSNYHYRYVVVLSFPPQLLALIPLVTLDTFDQSLNAELAASTAFSKSITPDSGYLHNASPVLGFNVSANLPSSGGTNSPLMKL